MKIRQITKNNTKINVCKACHTKLNKIQALRKQLSNYLDIDNKKVKENLNLAQLKQVEQIIKSNLVQEKGSLVDSAEINEALSIAGQKRGGRFATCYLNEIQQKIKDLEEASKKEQEEPKPNPGRENEPKPNPSREPKPNPPAEEIKPNPPAEPKPNPSADDREGNEKHLCPGCKKEYFIETSKQKIGGDEFECLSGAIQHHKVSKYKCFWDALETKQKIQEYRSKFSKWLDFRHGGFAIAVNQKQLSLADLQECKREILAIPAVDDLVVKQAFSCKESDNHIVETGGSPYKYWLVLEINEKIKKKAKEPEHRSRPKEFCERCQKEERHWRLTWITVNSVREIHWFGENCSCLQQFRNERIYPCSQCQKREYPQFKNGWLIDFEIKKLFCSPECHVAYRNISYEQASSLTQIEMIPPELELPIAEATTLSEIQITLENELPTSENEGQNNEGQNIVSTSESNQQNVDWEKAGSKKEVLFWKEYSKKLEQKLSNQSNLTPDEKQQTNYLKNLIENTLESAEKAFSSKYGKEELNALLSGKQKIQQPKKNYLPWIIGGVGLVVISGLVGLVFYFWNKSKNKEKSHDL